MVLISEACLAGEMGNGGGERGGAGNGASWGMIVMYLVVHEFCLVSFACTLQVWWLVRCCCTAVDIKCHTYTTAVTGGA